MTDNTNLIDNEDELLRRGVCRIRLPQHFPLQEWAAEYSQVTPLNLAAEGDGEYAFYRNILEEPNFPFDEILKALADPIQRYFGLRSINDIRLDDGFCVHYNMEQEDSSGAKHTDPSDITVNLCIEKDESVEGSQVKFYGSQRLHEVEKFVQLDPSEEFLVDQKEGFATIHWGHHPHETMALTNGGVRTNLVLTYCYSDPSKSDVSMRDCYY